MSGIGRPHPGAAQFPEPARRAVADGDLFDLQHHGFYVRRSDGRDLIAALLFAADLADVPIAGGTYAARRLGLAVDTNPRDQRIVRLNALGERNDRGDYRHRANLYLDLLGKEWADG